MKAYPVDKNGIQNGPEQEFEDWRWAQMKANYKEFRWVEIKEKPKRKRVEKKKKKEIPVEKVSLEKDYDELNEEFKKDFGEGFADEQINPKDDLA